MRKARRIHSWACYLHARHAETVRALGYVTWQATTTNLLGEAGTAVRGHEFHYSRLEATDKLKPSAALLRTGEDVRPDGFVNGRLLAGYAHLHFGSNPAVVKARGLSRDCNVP